jgi:hypothetical protein
VYRSRKVPRVNGAALVFELVNQDGNVIELPVDAPASDELGINSSGSLQAPNSDQWTRRRARPRKPVEFRKIGNLTFFRTRGAWHLSARLETSNMGKSADF